MAIDDFDKGFDAGWKAAVAQVEKKQRREAKLTLTDVKAGRYSDDELIARKAELDAALEGQR